MGKIVPGDVSGAISSLSTLSSKSKVSITNASVPAAGTKVQKVTITTIRTAINKLETSFSNNCCQSVNANCCQSCQSSICQSCQVCQSCQDCQTQTCQSYSCQSCQSCQGCQTQCSQCSCQSCQRAQCSTSYSH